MQRVELIATQRWSGAEGKVFPGQRIVVEEKRAQQLLDEKRARLPDGVVASVKEDAGAAKKSSGAQTTGRLTSTPSSSAPGMEILFSVSVAGQACWRKIAKSFAGAAKRIRGFVSLQ